MEQHKHQEINTFCLQSYISLMRIFMQQADDTYSMVQRITDNYVWLIETFRDLS